MDRERVWTETLSVNGLTLCASLCDIVEDGNARRFAVVDQQGTTLVRLPVPRDRAAVSNNPRLLLLSAWSLKREPLTLIVERAEPHGESRAA